MVSRQASRLVEEAPAIAVAHFRAEAEPYDPELRPDGYVNVGTAENRLVWDLVEPVLTGARPVSADDVRYAPLYGAPALRAAIAHHLARWWGTEVDPEDLVVAAGATAALDIAATTLCDPGDVIVVPAPYYGAFDVDLAGRSGARLVSAPLAAADGFALSPEAVDQALAAARAAGLTPRAVAVTSPANPTGTVHGAAALRKLLAVAATHGVDVIADEIYANSVFGPEPFHSVRRPAVSDPGDGRAHVVWGFAKDFGLPGLKVGVLHTRDPDVRAAARELAYFAPVSTDTQALLVRLLANDEAVDFLLAEARRRLAASHAHATARLDEAGIPYAPAGAGFSLWCDLRRWLPEPTAAAEHALWQRILDHGRVNVMPGGVFSSPEPGWFRLCHTLPASHVAEAVARLTRVLAPPTTGRTGGAPGARPPAPYERWYQVAGVRGGTRRMFEDERDRGKVFFPQRLVPHLAHEAVRARPAERRDELACRHLVQFLQATTHMETRVVNAAAERIANGRSGLDLPAATRLDAFTVYTDEGYHALYSLDMADQVVEVTGIEMPPIDHGRFVGRVEATRDRLFPGEPVLGELVQVVVFETLITAVLHEVPQDDAVMTPVRDLLRDHARDEGRHHRFFSGFFLALWGQLDAGARQMVAQAMPPLIHDCLRADTGPVAGSLVLAGLTPDAAAQVVTDTYDGDQARRRARDVAGATIRLCRAAGVLDAPGAREAFAAHGLDLPEAP